MPLAFNQTGPYALQGQVFSATLGTAIAFSAGLALAYSGIGIVNPANSGRKVTLLRAGLAPSSTGPASMAPWGFAKLTGTGTQAFGTLSAFSGAVVCVGVSGTAAVNGTSAFAMGTNQGTSVCSVFGTASVLAGTAGPSVNGLNWVGPPLGVHGTNLIGATVSDLAGEVTLLPGESGVLASLVAVTALANLVWLESSL